MNVLVINAGSSSLKYQLLDMKTETLIAKGTCDRIGIDGHIKHTPLNGKPVFDSDAPFPTHKEAIEAVIDKLKSDEYGVIGSLEEIAAVGHRVLTGGQKFTKSVLIDNAALNAIEACEPLGPLHIPANLMGIRACQNAMPNVPQVAVFDTAFHQTMPPQAHVYAIPYEYYTEKDLRRYGFHGTSHLYIADKAISLLGGRAEGTKIINCHLGNGASIAAIKDGKSVDTTMGLTPLEGLVMGTRCGSVDPALFSVLAKMSDLTIDETLDMLNKQSGVLGLSGFSSDFRDVEKAAGIDIETGDPIEGNPVNPRAELALDVFNYNVIKFIGAYITVMGGVDAIVFTAGVGENSPYTRRRICELLEGIGICIDKQVNKFRGVKGVEYVDITGEGSVAKVFVIPTDEELVIARDTKDIVGG